MKQPLLTYSFISWFHRYLILHCELVTVSGEFRLHETHLFSLFLNMVPHHQKCLRDSLLNVDETSTETGLMELNNWHSWDILSNYYKTRALCTYNLTVRTAIRISRVESWWLHKRLMRYWLNSTWWGQMRNTHYYFLEWFKAYSLTAAMFGSGLGFRGLSKSGGVRRIGGEKDGPLVLAGAGSPLVEQ